MKNNSLRQLEEFRETLARMLSLANGIQEFQRRFQKPAMAVSNVIKLKSPLWTNNDLTGLGNKIVVWQVKTDKLELLWKEADFYVELYNIEAKTIIQALAVLTHKSETENNTKKMAALLSKHASQAFDSYTEISRALSHERDVDKEEWSGGWGGNSRIITLQNEEQAQQKTYIRLKEISDKATAEWNMVRRLVKETDLTPREYKKLINNLRK